ncbi:MAG: S41 family peptidase [Cyclobacteriaceae bacterium]
MSSRILLFSLLLFAIQENLAQPFEPNNYSAYQKTLVDKIAKSYETQYVFPEKGLEASKYLKTQFKKGAYDGLTNTSLSEKLTQDLQAVTNDKHVRINFILKDKDSKPTNSIADFEKRFKNYGFEEVKIMDGNIGYIDLRLFYPIQNDVKSKQALKETMSQLEATDAIVFDLRKCVGGSPEMLALIISYFYPEGSRIHLNSFYYRPNNSTFESYTLEEIEGNRMPDKKLFVLTGSKSFSAAEEFSYDLKYLKRATLVGAITGGGAHTVEPRQIDENFEMFVPTGRAINPITNSNWEGVGVKPDVEVDEVSALRVAHILALEESIANAKSNAEKVKLRTLISSIENQN